MNNYTEEYTNNWVHKYWVGYCTYMEEFYPTQFFKFRMNIVPPQKVGAGIGISQAATHSDEEYKEIMKITHRFCIEYPDPMRFPQKFDNLCDK